MITPYLPYPLWSGGQIRTYNLLKHLSKKHEISLFSFIRDEKERLYIPHLRKYCNNVKLFRKRPPWSITSLGLAAMTFYPLVVCMYLNKQVQKAISDAIGKEHFDLIHAETFYVMPNIAEQKTPIILAEQTIEYLVYKHFTETIPLLPTKLLMGWDVAKIKFWEQRFWKRALRVVAMSEADKQVMHTLTKNLTVDLVPNGVDVSFFQFRKHFLNKKMKTVLFVGNFKWLQNREAADILVTKVWPIIQSKIPSVRLWIVGRFPTKEIFNYSSDSITISDKIEDIRSAYNNADILVAPIYGPGGTRYKILEAMATGLPVITTSTGIEGLGVQHRIHAFVQETPNELAKGTIKVLTDKNLYTTLAYNGRKLVENNFSWEKIAASLDTIYGFAAGK